MTAYLTHLAGRAQGVSVPGAARPSLPSRFAGPQPWGEAAPDSNETVASAAVGRAQSVPPIAPPATEGVSSASLAAPDKAPAAPVAPATPARLAPAIEAIVRPATVAVTRPADQVTENRRERPVLAHASS